MAGRRADYWPAQLGLVAAGRVRVRGEGPWAFVEGAAKPDTACQPQSANGRSGFAMLARCSSLGFLLLCLVPYLATATACDDAESLGGDSEMMEGTTGSKAESGSTTTGLETSESGGTDEVGSASEAEADAETGGTTGIDLCELELPFQNECIQCLTGRCCEQLQTCLGDPTCACGLGCVGLGGDLVSCGETCPGFGSGMAEQGLLFCFTLTCGQACADLAGTTSGSGGDGAGDEADTNPDTGESETDSETETTTADDTTTDTEGEDTTGTDTTTDAETTAAESESESNDGTGSDTTSTGG